MNKVFEDLKGIILGQTFPCIGAQKALRDDAIGFFECPVSMDDSQAAIMVCEALYQWMKTKDYKSHETWGPLDFTSFITIFPGPNFVDEMQAEKILWEFLAAAFRYDTQLYPWDPKVSQCVYDVNFSMSLGGYAHFIPLLSPVASSLSRQFRLPVLVFNPHFVFANLRRAGLFDSWRDIIRKRELTLQGWVNPKLGDFGECLEAPQYALTKSPGFHIGYCWKKECEDCAWSGIGR